MHALKPIAGFSLVLQKRRKIIFLLSGYKIKKRQYFPRKLHCFV